MSIVVVVATSAWGNIVTSGTILVVIIASMWLVVSLDSCSTTIYFSQWLVVLCLRTGSIHFRGSSPHDVSSSSLKIVSIIVVVYINLGKSRVFLAFIVAFSLILHSVLIVDGVFVLESSVHAWISRSRFHSFLNRSQTSQTIVISRFSTL